MLKVKLLLLGLFLGSWQLISAQSGLVSSGGEAIGSQGSVSFSIGQIDYTAYKGDNWEITLGVQQPYEIFIPTDINLPEYGFNIDIFPNPATDVLTITTDDPQAYKLRFKLTDLSGKIIRHQSMDGERTAIPFSNMTKGIYFISIYRDHQLINSHKIIKNQ